MQDSLIQQTEEVVFVTFSSDSRTILMALRTGDCCVISDFTEGLMENHRQKFTTHIEDRSFRTRAAFSKDSQTVSILSESTKKYSVLHVTVGNFLFTKEIPEEVFSSALLTMLGQLSWLVAFRPMDNTVTARIVDIQTDEVRDVKASIKVHNDYISCMEFSSRGSFFATGTVYRILDVWKIATVERVLSLDMPGYGGIMLNIGWSSDENNFICVHTEYIFIIDIQTGQTIRDIRLGYLGEDIWPIEARLSPDGRDITHGTRYMGSGAYSKEGCNIYSIDLKLGKLDPVPSLLFTMPSNLSSLAFSPDGTMLAAASENGDIRLNRVAMPFHEHSLWEKGDDSGWVLGPNKELLVWVPPTLRERLNWTPQLCGEAIGTSWTKCFVEQVE